MLAPGLPFVSHTDKRSRISASPPCLSSLLTRLQAAMVGIMLLTRNVYFDGYTIILCDSANISAAYLRDLRALPP